MLAREIDPASSSSLPSRAWICSSSRSCLRLVAEPEFSHERAIALDIGPPQVVEQPLSPPDHDQHPAPRVVVLLVLAQMLLKLIDARRQQRHLHLG